MDLRHVPKAQCMIKQSQEVQSSGKRILLPCEVSLPADRIVPWKTGQVLTEITTCLSEFLTDKASP